MRELLARGLPIDAVFAANDAMAAGAVDAAHAAGLRVPNDVAVAGFDDNSVATATEPALTTIHQPYGRIGSEMVRLLLEIVDGETPASVTVPTSLVVRESA